MLNCCETGQPISSEDVTIRSPTIVAKPEEAADMPDDCSVETSNTQIVNAEEGSMQIAPSDADEVLPESAKASSQKTVVDFSIFASAAQMSAALDRIAALDHKIQTLEGEKGAAFELAAKSAVEAEIEARKLLDVTKADEGPTVEGADVKRAGGVSLSRVECEEIAFSQENSHTIESTVWEAPLLAFTPAVHSLSSLGLVLVVVFNFCFQIMFCVVAVMVLANDDTFPNPDDVVRWRETIGHQEALMDKGSWVSLVEQVCESDGTLVTSGYQVSVLEGIDDYILPVGGVPQGPALGVLCLLLWLLSVAQELRNSLSFLLAVVRLPRGNTVIGVLGEELVLESIAYGRFLAICLTTLMRVSIAVVLAWAGAWWLVFTVSTSDMLLNAAALTFVLDLDEILFATLLPATLQVLVSKIQPLPRSWVKVRGVDMWPLIVFIWCSGFVCYHVFTSIITRVADLQEMRGTLCGGKTNFVMHHDTDSNMVLAVDTYSLQTDLTYEDYLPYVAHGDASDLTYLRRSARQLIEGTTDNMDSLCMQLPRSSFRSSVQMTMEDYARSNSHCMDLDLRDPLFLPNSYVLAMVDTLTTSPEEFDSVDRSLLHCEDYVDHCRNQTSRFLRLFCPQTCGCADPFSGLLFKQANNGCPIESCRALPAYTESLGNVSCEDKPLEELRQSPGWHRYWETYRRYHNASGLIDFVQNFSDQVGLRGCGALVDDPYSGTIGVCGDRATVSTLRAFCPVACGCQNDFGADCPSQCAPANVPQCCQDGV